MTFAVRPLTSSGLPIGFALAAGLTIGWMDSRPGFDDTGITVFGLLVAAGLTSFLGATRPWLFALLVGGFVPLLEIPQGGGGASLFALLFSAVGAGVGYVLRSVFEANR